MARKSRAPGPSAVSPLAGLDVPSLVERLILVANPDRLALLFELAGGELNVGALRRLLGKGQSPVSQLLTRLRLGGLVQARREGRRRYYGLTPAGVAIVAAVRRLMARAEGGEG